VLSLPDSRSPGLSSEDSAYILQIHSPFPDSRFLGFHRPCPNKVLSFLQFDSYPEVPNTSVPASSSRVSTTPQFTPYRAFFWELSYFTHLHSQAAVGCSFAVWTIPLNGPDSLLGISLSIPLPVPTSLPRFPLSARLFSPPNSLSPDGS